MVHFVVLVVGEDPFELLYPYYDLRLFSIESLEKYHLKEWCFPVSTEDTKEEIEKMLENTKNELSELENKRFINNSKEEIDNKDSIRICKERLTHMNELKGNSPEFVRQFFCGLELVEEPGGYHYYHNLNGKFDWLVFGGRWNGFLKLKNGESASQAYKSEVDWEWHKKKGRYPFVLINEDEWYTMCEDGWCDKSEIPDMEGYMKGFWERIKKLPENQIITVADCHE